MPRPSRSRMTDSVPPPTVGTFIDDGQLELVSTIGEGGFSTVFLARPVSSPSSPKHQQVYAVKVLQSPPGHSSSRSSQRTLHLREATLHSLCSTHPSIAPLRKIVFHHTYTCLVMDYYPSGDLFTAILTNGTYLGRPSLIKDVFMQILEGVEHCHAKGVFLRDLKPENVLVSDEGRRIHLTDFGLATGEKESSEFRTGSVYHMSPECMGPTPYSPRQNDIWSLGILLLNLVTSRNPWRSAHPSDATYAAYLSPSPHSPPLLPRILPISKDLNALLERILTIDPERRMSIKEMKRSVEKLGESMSSWYASDVVFEGGCARCAWEVEAESSSSNSRFEENENEDVGGESVWSDSSDTQYTPSNSSPSSSPRTSPNPKRASFHHSRKRGSDSSSPSTPPSSSTSVSSLGGRGPRTPRDIATFGNLKVVEPDSTVSGTRGERGIDTSADSVPATLKIGKGENGFGRRLFGKVGLFGRS